jgi:hypothetical protein
MTKSKFAGALSALDAIRERQPDNGQEGDILQRQDAKASEHQDAKVRVSVYFRRSTHKALKFAAIEEERDVSAIIEELAAKWILERQNIKAS